MGRCSTSTAMCQRDSTRPSRSLEKRGVMFAPASGRQYYSLEDSFMKYKDRFLFLAENGTVVMYKGEKIFTCPMNKQLAQQVLMAAEPLENVYSVFCGTKNGYVLKHQYTEEFLAEAPQVLHALGAHPVVHRCSR